MRLDLTRLAQSARDQDRPGGGRGSGGLRWRPARHRAGRGGDPEPRRTGDQPRANCLLLRGFATQSQLPSLHLRHGLTPAAVAVYPMYRGIARLVGMEVVGKPRHLEDQVDLLRAHWSSFDFYFVHHKPADSAGEDGDFDTKVAAIEEFDAVVPQLLALSPDVLAVTGDHATPSGMAGHSWHPVPVVLRAERAGRDEIDRFGERWCGAGLLGRRPSHGPHAHPARVRRSAGQVRCLRRASPGAAPFRSPSPRVCPLPAGG